MTPNQRQILGENRVSPFCLTVYDVLGDVRTIKDMLWRIPYFLRYTYRNYSTKRLNITLRFTTPTDRDHAAEKIDTLGLRFRVFDDKKGLRP